MKIAISRHWPLILSVIILWLTVAILLTLSIKKNEGHIIYALDDPYIHMAIAKNFSQHGVWGITKYEFSSSSSSLLWTFLLSLIYFIFGINEISPLILNIVFATSIIFLIHTMLIKQKLPSLYILICTFSIIFIPPLPALIFIGMEHILHALITILFAYFSTKELSKEIPASLSTNSMPVFLWVLAALVPLVRYEGLFLILAVCSLFALRKRWSYAFFLGIFAILPIFIYGTISYLHGWFWLPNSVQLKGNVSTLISLTSAFKLLGYSCYKNLLKSPHILFLIIAALVLYTLRFGKQKKVWEKEQLMIVIFIITTFLHMQFIPVFWFYRYDAYLVALGLAVVAIPLYEHLPKGGTRKIVIDKTFLPKYATNLILILLLALPVFSRIKWSIIQLPRATTNIYEQQYQMGLFLKQFYCGIPVAANDIGAINFLADINCLDLWGLGSKEVAKSKRNGAFGREQIYDLTKSKNIKIALLYESKSWFLDKIPYPWTKAGEWIISNNVVCGGDTVSFYVVDPSEENNLIANLKQFAFQLPNTIKQSGKYYSEITK